MTEKLRMADHSRECATRVSSRHGLHGIPCDCGFVAQEIMRRERAESATQPAPTTRDTSKSKMITDQRESALPTDSEVRKSLPMASGVLDYFPAALAAVAELSKVGNDKHNPGEDLHWARGKSMDHADTIVRHLVERGSIDTDGLLHDTKVAWRALAMLQEELERRGAPMSRGSRIFDAEPKQGTSTALPIRERAPGVKICDAKCSGYVCNRAPHKGDILHQAYTFSDSAVYSWTSKCAK